MIYLKKSIALPLVWVHGHAAQKTEKTRCVSKTDFIRKFPEKFGAIWHLNQRELGYSIDMTAYICVLTMIYLEKSISLLAWIHGHVGWETSKTLCVIEYRRCFSHLLSNFEIIWWNWRHLSCLEVYPFS